MLFRNAESRSSLFHFQTIGSLSRVTPVKHGRRRCIETMGAAVAHINIQWHRLSSGLSSASSHVENSRGAPWIKMRPGYALLSLRVQVGKAFLGERVVCVSLNAGTVVGCTISLRQWQISGYSKWQVRLTMGVSLSWMYYAKTRELTLEMNNLPKATRSPRSANSKALSRV